MPQARFQKGNVPQTPCPKHHAHLGFFILTNSLQNVYQSFKPEIWESSPNELLPWPPQPVSTADQDLPGPSPPTLTTSSPKTLPSIYTMSPHGFLRCPQGPSKPLPTRPSQCSLSDAN